MKRVNIEALKVAAAGRWKELLADLGGLPYEVLDGKHHPCPKCGGTDRFRMIDQEAGAILCNQCFREKNGDGLSALQWATGRPLDEVLVQVADRLGVKLKRFQPKKERISPLPWSNAVARLWLLKKPGISIEALHENGAELGLWTSVQRIDHHVLSIPVITSQGAPRGHVLYATSGGLLPTQKGGLQRVIVTAGTKPGWIGKHAIENIAEAKVVWKVEGVSDMLALHSAIPRVARRLHVALSNAFGALEKPRPELTEIFYGKKVVIVADRDEVGQKGAERWADALARHASEVRILNLPDGPWKDVRDWLNAGGNFDELRTLARAAPIYVPEEEPADEWDEEDDDPSRLAELFLRAKNGNLRDWREDFYEYTGGAWRLADMGDIRSEVAYLIRNELRRIWAESMAARKNEDAPPFKVKRISPRLVDGVVRLMRDYSKVPSYVEWGAEIEEDEEGRVARFEYKPHLAFQNGLLDLDRVISGDKKSLKPLDRRYWSPHVFGFEYDPSADLGPYWIKFLCENLDGDEDRINVLQEWMGYCLVPWTDLQKCLILEGEGANGKSVFCAALEAVLGAENVSHLGLELFGQRFALSATIGKLANISNDVGELDTVAEGTFKAFVSGERITVDRKGKEPLTIIPTARLTIATNNRPRFSDRSSGVWRRILLLPLTYTVPPGKRIPGMDKDGWWAKGPGAAELPGILNWALEGLIRLKINGAFSESACVQNALEDYRTEMNPARSFLLDRYVPHRDLTLRCQDVYNEYVEWCRETGHRPLASTTFGKEVFRLWPSVERWQFRDGTSRYWGYKGLGRRSAEGIEESDQEGEAAWSA